MSADKIFGMPKKCGMVSRMSNFVISSYDHLTRRIDIVKTSNIFVFPSSLPRIIIVTIGPTSSHDGNTK